jgi:uncharacterized membrane protein
MQLRAFHIVSVVCLVLMFGLSAYAWIRLPPDAQTPVHWNLSGEVDGYASKTFALLFVPVLTVGLVVLLSLIPRLDPRRTNLYRSSTPYQVICSAVVVLMLVVHAGTILIALGAPLDLTVVIGVGVGALLFVIGTQLGNTRSNWFMGVRTPWTLESELSWRKTHHLAGRLFMAIGLISGAVAVFGPPELYFWVLLLSLLGGIVWIIRYSYVVWRDDPDRVVHRPAD